MRHLILVFTAFLMLFAEPAKSFAQTHEFNMSALNQSMGTLVQTDSSFADNSLAQNSESEDNIGVIILRLAGSLVIVLMLVALTSRIIRKTGLFKKNGISAANQTPSMSVLEALSTGQNGVVFLLKCEDKVFLLGQTQTRYTLLQELPADTSKKIIADKAGDETIGGFKNSLSSFMQNIKISKTVSGQA